MKLKLLLPFNKNYIKDSKFINLQNFRFEESKFCLIDRVGKFLDAPPHRLGMGIPNLNRVFLILWVETL